ncbi:hypothetical protein HQ545_06770 [Candidatus Woesearchaeota archaeon]|nr:hypothetical protein [Candidatus Woesearchaeota archaeon]
MNTKNIIIILPLLALIITLAAGCAYIPQDPDSNATKDDNTTDQTEPAPDIVEKRGQKTNITKFNELLTRATKIKAFKYKITDTGMEGTNKDTYSIKMLGRYVKIGLPEPREHDTGEVFDEVIMDRLTKTAFTHCSSDLCLKPELDRELEKVEYETYYMPDPLEYIYKITDTQYVKEEMLGDQYTKVFNAQFEKRPARVWLQEYYGFPLKIIIRMEDDNKRTITFDDMIIDNTRLVDIKPPFNFTVKGEEGTWIMWEHYLGDWPPQNNVNLDQRIPLTA